MRWHMDVMDILCRNLDAILMQQLNNASGSRSRSHTFADLEMLVSDIEEAVSRMAISPQPVLLLSDVGEKGGGGGPGNPPAPAAVVQGATVPGLKVKFF
jgi:hypothetical protein